MTTTTTPTTTTIPFVDVSNDVKAYKSLFEPTNPYLLYNDANRILNMSYRDWTSGALEKRYDPNNPAFVLFGMPPVDPVIWENALFQYERRSNMMAQPYGATSPVLGIGYSGAKSVTAMPAKVLVTALADNVNHGPTGVVSLSRSGLPINSATTVLQGETLNAVSTLADADGLGVFQYQWQSSVDGINWNPIGVPTAVASLTLAPALAGQRVRVRVNYTDRLGTAESVASASTAAVNWIIGTAGPDSLMGTTGDDRIDALAGNDTVNGGEGNDTIDGGADNDILAGGLGRDTVNGGEGNDVILQDIGRYAEKLIGGGGIDTVDYSVTNLTGIATIGITANLVAGTVNKVFAGTSVDVRATGRFIRIYHTDAASRLEILALTEMKVFVAGANVAAGKPSVVGDDGGGAAGDQFNNPLALTDGALGEWGSSLAYVEGDKPYIELDLLNSYTIDSIALWGRKGQVAEVLQSQNLRMYVSNTSFKELTKNSPKTAYADLAAKTTVTRVDVAVVDAAPSMTFTDTLISIENLVGTALADSLTGDANANVLSGLAGNDTLAGGLGQDTLYGGEGDDVILQDIERFAETLNGGNNIDTVDYSVTNLAGIATTGITANLTNGNGTVKKVLDGTSVGVGATGRFIRIYHTDATLVLALNGLKVFAAGQEVAAGKKSVAGADAGFSASSYNNPWALTDTKVGGGWNGGSTPATSSLAYAYGIKPYIELDLLNSYNIDSIALWGDGTGQSQNLRVYVSSTPFIAVTGRSALNARIAATAANYASLAADGNVRKVDVAVVDTDPSTTFTDTLISIENLVGTALPDSLTGDGNANVLSGLAGNDTLAGGLGQDTIYGGDGNDVILQHIDRVRDMLYGGNDIDTVDYSVTSLAGIAAGITANLDNGNGAVKKVFVGTSVDVGSTIFYDWLYSIENVTGTAMADSLTGDANANVLSGGRGNDILAGGAGNDTLNGEDNDDTLIGGAGADTVSGGAGNDLIVQDESLFGDKLDGGAGINTVDYSGTGMAGNIRANLNANPTTGVVTVSKYIGGGVYTDTLTGIQNLIGTEWDDRLDGDSQPNTLSGGAGDDRLAGGAGNDRLEGEAGKDRLWGNAGNDTLVGGAGSDIYDFERGGGADVVQENDATDGNKDRLYLDDIQSGEVWLQKINNDLKLSIVGTSDSVTIAGWYTGWSAHVEEIYAWDKRLLDINVDKLVSAMSGFSPPTAGMASLTTTQKNQVLQAMAANWTAV